METTASKFARRYDREFKENAVAESGFRKIRHAEDLPQLATALSLSTTASAPVDAVASLCVPSESAVLSLHGLRSCGVRAR